MRAVRFGGVGQVTLGELEEPTVEQPTDVVVAVRAGEAGPLDQQEGAMGDVADALCAFEAFGEVEGRLPPELNDDCLRFLDFDHLQDILDGQGFEVEAV